MKKYIEKGMEAKSSSGQTLIWDGQHFIGINEKTSDIRYDGKEIYYDLNASTGLQDRGRPYIEVSEGGK